MIRNEAKPPVCVACGHCHAVTDACADHQWTDFCPYVGTKCCSKEERERRLAQQRADEEERVKRPDGT